MGSPSLKVLKVSCAINLFKLQTFDLRGYSSCQVSVKCLQSENHIEVLNELTKNYLLVVVT